MPTASELPHRILGIDPGSRNTGYAVLDTNGRESHCCASGVIRVGNHTWPQRLGMIFAQMQDLVAEWQPHEVAIEQLIFARDPSAALKLGQARGAILCAVLQQALDIHEYNPKVVKMAVVGSGAASKAQVQQMVKMLLSLPTLPAEDEADALAIALCHAHSMNIPGRKRMVASWRDWRP